MSDELKCCPFCGGEARIKHLITAGIRTHGRVECTNCHIKTDYYVHEFGERNLIAIWNRRATTTTHAIIVSDESTDCATGHCECELCGEPIDPWDRYCKWCGAEVER